MKGDHHRRSELSFAWPEPPLRIVLVEPCIPPNTGNIARLCAATGSELHLVEPLGFDISDRAVRRAGLDYWDSVSLHVHPSWAAAQAALATERLHLFSTAGTASIYERAFAPGDALVFGSETAGLSEELLAERPGQVVGIPIRPDHVRSLNLSTAVGVCVYEALRQIQHSDIDHEQ